MVFTNLLISLIFPLQCKIKLQPAFKDLITFSLRDYNSFLELEKLSAAKGKLVSLKNIKFKLDE